MSVILACIAVVSCKEDDLTGGLAPMDVKLSLSKTGVQALTVSSDAPVYEFALNKNYGVYATRATLKALSPDEISKVNADYVPLAENQYEFAEEVSIASSAVSQPVSVTFHDVTGLDVGKTYAMGLCITSSANGKVRVDEKNSSVIITLTVGKEGSISNPFRVSTAREMIEVREKTRAFKGHVNDALEEIGTDRIYISMTDDVDFSGIVFYEDEPDNPDRESNWQPWDNAELPLHFEGNNHTIKNLVVKSGDGASFFGYLKGTVQNLRFENAIISSDGSNTGVVAGTVGLSGAFGIEAPGHLRNVHVLSGTVTHKANAGWVGWTGHAGGLAGDLMHRSSTIRECSANVDVTGEFAVGGLLGQANGAALVDCCYASGNVVGRGIKATGNGELAGPNDNFKDIKFYADCYVGGLIGQVIATQVTNCYSTGKVTAERNLPVTDRGVAGGLVGKTYKDAVITNSYSTSEVSGLGDAGSIIGTQAWEDGGNNYIAGCIAWSDKVAAVGRPGRVTGFFRRKNPVSRGEFCYANAGMELLENNRKVENFEDGELLDSFVTTMDLRYEGIECDNIIDAADKIGWSSSHWDLSGAMPKLQWEKEQNLPAIE